MAITTMLVQIVSIPGEPNRNISGSEAGSYLRLMKFAGSQRLVLEEACFATREVVERAVQVMSPSFFSFFFITLKPRVE